MKKTLHLTLILILPTIVACQEYENMPQAENDNEIEVLSFYDICQDSINRSAYRLYTDLISKLRINDSIISVNPSISGSELVDFIVSISNKSEFTNQLNFDTKSSEDNLIYENKIWDKLYQNIPSNEIIDYENFMNDYIDMNGHNQSFLLENIKDKSEITKSLMIIFAATTDYFMPENKTRFVNLDYCLQQLYSELIRWVSLDVADAVILIIDVEDPFLDLLEAGLDASTALSIVHQYDLCRATHINL